MVPELTVPASPQRWDIVFLDRDGTINERVEGYVDDPGRLVVLPGAAAAIARLNALLIPVILVTNQRGLSTGELSRAAWESVMGEMRRLLALEDAHIDRVMLCPHDEGECGCRKPLPGLFEAALSERPWARPEQCVMIGDMPSDVAPALALGMHAVQIGQDVACLADAVDSILSV